MKKFWLFLPVVLLAMGGLLMIGCASDPDEGKKVEPDFVMEGGKYEHFFTTPVIQKGTEYEVIFTIDDCDDALIGSHLGGNIFYKPTEGEDLLLCGWRNGTPETVGKATKEYKWTFEGGVKYNDSKNPVEDFTTLTGGQQYFSVMAQTSSWSEYPASTKFGIKGNIVVRVKEAIGYVSAGTVTLGNADGTAGKGELSDADMATIRALPAGSILRLTVKVTPVSGTAEPGWGVGTVGTWTEAEAEKIIIPDTAVIGTEITFDVDYSIATILNHVGASGKIAINLYNGATATKGELFKLP
jgi:hypothetical protein